MSGAQAASGSVRTNRESLLSPSDKARGKQLETASAKPLPGTMLCLVLLGLAIVLGGGGTVNPQTEMVLQVLTALVMLPLVSNSAFQRGLGSVQTVPMILAGLVLLIPVIQLIPLPPMIWKALPGRALEAESLALIQADNSWMPLTMAPARTFASLLATICPVLLMLQASRLSIRARNWLCGIISAGGLLSLALGVLQLSHTGGFNWSIYSEFSEGYLVGFQANRNAQADVLLAAILATGALASSRLMDSRQHLLTWTCLILAVGGLFVGLFMTGSRTGIALSVVALTFLILMLWPVLKKRSGLLYGIFGSFVLMIVGGGLLSQLPSVQKVVGRFSLVGEIRWDLWADTKYAITQVWPFGSGVGTIVPMLEAAERLEVVDTTRPVRAHSDWLEWVLEAGLPGIIVLGLILLTVGYISVRAIMSIRRSDATPSRRGQVLFSIGFLLIEALHALVDYPMRSMSLAALTAVAAAMLLETAAAQRRKP